MLGDGTCGLAEHVGKHIVELEVGHGEAILCAVLFAGDHVRELHAIANEVEKLADDGRRDKDCNRHPSQLFGCLLQSL